MNLHSREDKKVSHFSMSYQGRKVLQEILNLHIICQNYDIFYLEWRLENVIIGEHIVTPTKNGSVRQEGRGAVE